MPYFRVTVRGRHRIRAAVIIGNASDASSAVAAALAANPWATSVERIAIQCEGVSRTTIGGFGLKRCERWTTTGRCPSHREGK